MLFKVDCIKTFVIPIKRLILKLFNYIKSIKKLEQTLNY